MTDVGTELNNLAVEQLEAGDPKAALDTLRAALRIAVNKFKSPPPEGAKAEPPSTTDDERMPRHHPQDIEVLGRQVIASKEASPFVYTRAIPINAAAGAYSQNSVTNTTVISTIIVFNLGIVYHVLGIEEGSRGQSQFSKALALYHKCHILLSNAGMSAGASGIPVVDLLAMALCNNMAQAFFELTDYRATKHYFDELLRFSSTVVPTKYNDANVAAQLDQIKSTFLLNAIILHAPDLAAAA